MSISQEFFDTPPIIEKICFGSDGTCYWCNEKYFKHSFVQLKCYLDSKKVIGIAFVCDNCFKSEIYKTKNPWYGIYFKNLGPPS